MESIVDKFDETISKLNNVDHNRIVERTGMLWYYLPEISTMFSTLTTELRRNIWAGQESTGRN